jgi:hypothetical protein
MAHVGHEVVDTFGHHLLASPAWAQGLLAPPVAPLGDQVLRLQLIAPLIHRTRQLPQLPGDLAGREVAAPEGGEQVIPLVEIALLGNRVELQPGLDAETGQLLFQQGATLGDIAVVILLLEPEAHPVARPRGPEIALMNAEPVAAGGGVLLGDDLDRLTAAQGLVERDDTTIDLGAPAAIADLGMDGIGKIQGRGAARQIDDLGLGREHINVGGLELRLEAFKKIGPSSSPSFSSSIH